MSSMIFALMLATAVSNPVRVTITILPSPQTEVIQCREYSTPEICDCVSRVVVSTVNSSNIHLIDEVRRDAKRICENPDSSVDNI